MPRRAKRIVLLLLAGAIANVAVAWGCVLVHGPVPRYEVDCRIGRPDPPWNMAVTRRWGYENASEYFWLGSTKSPAHARAYEGRPWWPAGESFWRDTTHAVASGWPLLTLMGWYTAEFEPSMHGAVTVTFEPHWGVRMAEDVFGRVAQRPAAPMLFPLRPVWSGMIGNTLFYAILLWLPFYGAPALRRAVRRRHGLCPRCAYPVGDSERCSECGTPVPARRASAG